jgi:hypothetical protein
MGPDEVPVWNTMLHMYIPVHESVGTPGQEYEQAVLEAAEFMAENEGHTNILIHMAHEALLQSIEEKLKKLSPFLNQWMIARHGMSLN